MTGGKTNECGDGGLRSHDGDGEEDGRSSVDDEGEERGEGKNRAEICGENCGERNRERDEVGVVATIEKDGIPSPERGDSGNDDGEHHEEIFVGESFGESVEGVEVAAHEVHQRAVFFEHQERDKQARHGEENCDNAWAEVELAVITVAAAVKHAAEKEAEEGAEGRAGEGSELFRQS